MRLESGGSEFGFRPQNALNIINHPPPSTMLTAAQRTAAVGANAGARS